MATEPLKRIQVLMPQSEISAVDTWRRKEGIDSRSAAIRLLAQRKLEEIKESAS